MELALNMGKPVFVHAVLVVQDVLGGTNGNHSTSTSWLQNFEIYIGNSSDYTKNSKCLGGPFMKVDDVSNYVGGVWVFGVEAWCNFEG